MLGDAVNQWPIFVYTWFTLGTEAEAETEESLRSSVNHENGDGRILRSNVNHENGDGRVLTF